MKRPCVLICDDDEGIVDATKYILEAQGYEVCPVTDSHQIYHEIDEHHPKLVIIDLWMPDIGGAEITKTLKQNPATMRIPVIILSAHRETASIASEVGADDYLQKPFDITDLENLVSKYVHLPTASVPVSSH